jgi:hypothetical protein
VRQVVPFGIPGQLGQEAGPSSLAVRAVFSLMFIGFGFALGYAVGYQKCVQDTGVIRRGGGSRSEAE